MVHDDYDSNSEWDQARYWNSEPEAPRGDSAGPTPPEVAGPGEAARREAAEQEKPDRPEQVTDPPQTLWRRAHGSGKVAGQTGFTIIAMIVLTIVVGSVAWISLSQPTPVDGPLLSAPGRSAPAPAAPVDPDIPSDLAPEEPPPPSATPSLAAPRPSAEPTTENPGRLQTAVRRSETRQTGSPAPRPSSPAPRRYRLVSSLSGKSIGVSAGSTVDGAPIVHVGTEGSAQQWRLVDVGEGYFNIVNMHSGKALDNTDGSTANGTQMQQWTLIGTGNANQQWRFVPAGDGFYLIINRTSGHALDLRDGNLADGAAIQQWEPASTNPNQRWRIVVVS